jgi:hypothetical protein
MDAIDLATADDLTDPEALGELAASARGWHSIQLAVLGFIGFCGIFWDGGDPSAPAWLQWLPGMLVLGALLIALLAILLVGRVAYPFRGPARTAPEELRQTWTVRVRRLRRGIGLTYLAMAALVTATLSSWIPAEPVGDEAAVVADVTGQTWCGELVEGPGDQLRLDTEDGPVTVSLERVVVLHPVTVC